MVRLSPKAFYLSRINSVVTLIVCVESKMMKRTCQDAGQLYEQVCEYNFVTTYVWAWSLN